MTFERERDVDWFVLSQTGFLDSFTTASIPGVSGYFRQAFNAPFVEGRRGGSFLIPRSSRSGGCSVEWGRSLDERSFIPGSYPYTRLEAHGRATSG